MRIGKYSYQNIELLDLLLSYDDTSSFYDDLYKIIYKERFHAQTKSIS